MATQQYLQISGVRKLESMSYNVALFADPAFSRFSRTPTVTDRLTDRHRTIVYTAIA